MRKAECLLAFTVAVRKHRCVISRSYCITCEWKHTVVECAHIAWTEQFLFMSEYAFTCQKMRISPSLTCRFRHTMKVKKQFMLCSFFDQSIVKFHICLGGTVKEVRFDSCDSPLFPLCKTFFTLCRVFQIIVVCPYKETNTLFICILDQIFCPVKVAIICEFRMSLRVSFWLPSFV